MQRLEAETSADEGESAGVSADEGAIDVAGTGDDKGTGVRAADNRMSPADVVTIDNKSRCRFASASVLCRT